jgi:hypothetical protein
MSTAPEPKPEYPSEQTLAKIREWVIAGSQVSWRPSYEECRKLMNFVKDQWYAWDWGWEEFRKDTEADLPDRPEEETIPFYVLDGEKGTYYHISTAGWSGNESLIEAMRANRMFWSLCWVSTRRGGHYEFEVRDGRNHPRCGPDPAC